MLAALPSLFVISPFFSNHAKVDELFKKNFFEALRRREVVN